MILFLVVLRRDAENDYCVKVYARVSYTFMYVQTIFDMRLLRLFIKSVIMRIGIIKLTYHNM